MLEELLSESLPEKKDGPGQKGPTNDHLMMKRKMTTDRVVRVQTKAIMIKTMLLINCC